VGSAFNIDDSYVYVSWANQAAHGGFYAKNLFTTDDQLGRQFNLYILLIGNLSRICHLSVIALFEAVRVIGGATLLWVIYRLISWALPKSSTARLTSLCLVSMGTGLGWVFVKEWDKLHLSLPIDTWQPEAFTFLSILNSHLFVVSTLLIVSTMFFLIKAEERQSWKYALFAGLCALVLGNIHSYDILHIAAAWALYLIAKAVLNRKIDWKSWSRAALAGVICTPTVGYQFYLFKVDPIFHARAEVATLSQGFQTYALGFGLTIAFAIAALVMMARSEKFVSTWTSKDAPLIFACWAIGAFAMAYAPCSFQRKMIMGVDIPLSILAGAAVSFAGEWIAARKILSSASLLPALVVLLSVPTGLIWIAHDLKHLGNGDSETPAPSYLSSDDIALYDWISNTPKTSAFVGYPQYMLFVPGFCDRKVWSGHWGETPDYAQKFKRIIGFIRGRLDDPAAFLNETKANYVVILKTDPAPNLPLVYSNGSWSVYRIH
jgi:hypothetical protein